MKTALESQEQTALIKWAKFVKLKSGEPVSNYLAAIPNGGSRHPAEALNLKRQGVLAGMPDLMLFVPVADYHGLFIELKRRKGGIVSDSQKIVMARLRDAGYAVEVAQGWEMASRQIMSYLRAGEYD